MKKLWYIPFCGLGFAYATIWSSYSTANLHHGQRTILANTDEGWILALIASIVTPLICGLVFRGERAPKIRRLLAPATLALAFGMLFVLWGFYDARLPFLLFAGPTLIGAGIAVALLLWLDVISYLKIEEMEVVVPCSALVIFFAAVAFCVLPEPVIEIVTLLFPVVSSLALFFCYRIITRLDRSRSANETDLEQFFSAESFAPLRIAEISLGLFVLYFVAIGVSVSSASLKADTLGLILESAIEPLVGILFVIAFIRFSARIDFKSLMRLLSPFAVVAVALCYFPSASILTHGIADVIDISIRIVMYIQLSLLIKFHPKHGFMVAGIVLAASHLGCLCGNWATLEFARALEGSEALRAPVLLAVISVTVAALSIASRPSFKREATVSLGSTGESDAPLKKRCESIGHRFGLTPREVEIFSLLAQGRSQRYIQEYLTISKSTVSTHVVHIYKKCDIHSRQELINLVECF